MSEKPETETPKPVADASDKQTIEQATDQMRSLLDALVPPETITVFDIFGKEHKLKATTSARAQIKIARSLEEIRDIALPKEVASGELTATELIGLLGGLVTNEKVFEFVCKSVELAHPKLIKSLKESAAKEDVEYDPALPVADLMPIEEAIASIVPLFLRIARRTGQAIGTIAEATGS